MRRPIIAANWKMHKLIAEALALVEAVKAKPAVTSRAEVVLAPPLTSLFAVRTAVAASDIRLAAQNVFWEQKGAYTGEVSPAMLRDAGCSYVIIGHSERRRWFGDDDASINKKNKAVLKEGLNVIFCVGETLDQRESGKTRSVVLEQVERGLDGIAVSDLSGLSIAYEPVWAIGTGRNATPEQAEEVHAFIREFLRSRQGAASAEATRILYGGSVTPDNSAGLLRRADIDGALVGGASLDAASFYAIINSLN